jgi:hypothetical protein
MSESSKRKTDTAATGVTPEYVVTEFGRRRVGGVPWSARWLGGIVAWPFTFFARRKAARGRFPKSGA